MSYLSYSNDTRTYESGGKLQQIRPCPRLGIDDRVLEGLIVHCLHILLGDCCRKHMRLH